MKHKLEIRVWHIPQVPMKSFIVSDIKNFEDAFRLCNILGDYDQFQFENNVKPDYSNVNGVQFKYLPITGEDENDDGFMDVDEDDIEDILAEIAKIESSEKV